MFRILKDTILAYPKSALIGAIGAATVIMLGIGIFCIAKQGSGLKINATADNAKIETIFLELEQRSYSIPMVRDGAGGGLANFGDAIVVLTHDGRVFALEGDSLSLLPIQVPDNGLAKLVETAKMPKYNGYRFRWEAMRYNDILFYEDGGTRGAVVSYSFWDNERECYGSALALLPIDPSLTSIAAISANAEDWQNVFKTSPCLPPKAVGLAIAGRRAGGRILYKTGGKIILTSGDYEEDGVEGGRRLAQKDGNDYGKIIEVDLATGAAVHLAKGLRNPQGITKDLDGAVWVTDQGPRGGDELDLVVPGRNFGWPEATLGTRYNRLPSPGSVSYGRHNGYDKPTFAWTPSVAPSTITTVNGMHSAWDGDLMVGTLRAHSLFRIRIDNMRPLFVEPIPIGKRIRAVLQASDGRLAIWCDDYVLRILTVSDSGVGQKFLNIVISKTETTDSRKAELSQKFSRCAECHSFDYGTSNSAPPLGKIFTSPIGQGPYQGYSAALAAHGGTWTKEALTEFLTSVQTFAPGSTMPDPDIGDPELIDLMVDSLARLSVYRRTK